MDAVTVGILALGVGQILTFGLLWRLYSDLDGRQSDIDQSIADMTHGIEIVATVLNRLPEMVPQFAINQSPIGQLIEFFQNRQNQMHPQQTTLNDAQFERDAKGRYTNGETERETVEV